MNAFPLYLLRHGAPETPGLLMGRTDGLPTTEGIAGCVAQAADLDIEVVISSDLLRASVAAGAIGRRLGRDVMVDRRWRELDFGDWDGLAPAAIDRQAIGAFWDDPDANPPPHGERWSSLLARVSRAIGALEPRPTLVVTHGGAMRAALADLCGFAGAQLWALDLSYGALLALRVWPGERASGQVIGLWP
ncbi:MULTISPECIES: histidine phosphatase family protein [unclassified Sphingomonas]|uniref:histidine phosphatase family protein n=1 Tax=unclassified Sphingomonas TaxID=196159 RepID=UPI0006FE291B|nr:MULTISPECIES: histidine phosphatase family protein [unclassified Sphingomonas]KQX19400.1 phosphoglycerate mutase [Sphingomonas sp. Root1294]KQY65602.1 phosphoglycerate mutase [Sphingomonas sp. Root50]KRB95096.1 phosphoglycerate mutase [Sphingomonas sp. Root720]